MPKLCDECKSEHSEYLNSSVDITEFLADETLWLSYSLQSHTGLFESGEKHNLPMDYFPLIGEMLLGCCSKSIP